MVAARHNNSNIAAEMFAYLLEVVVIVVAKVNRCYINQFDLLHTDIAADYISEFVA